MDDGLDNRAEGSARPEGGREAPALGGGSGAARCGAPGGKTELGSRWSAVWFGVLATGTFFWILIFFGSMPGNADGTKFEEFLSLELNAMGDAIAGVSASLAFLWLLVTAFMQRAELAAQREELELTRSELFEQRLATQEIAKSTAAQVAIQEDQARIFRREAELRESDYAVHEVKQLLERVHSILVDRFRSAMTFERGDGTYGGFSMIDCLPRNISRGGEVVGFTSAELIHAYIEAYRRTWGQGTPDTRDDVAMLRVMEYLKQVGEYSAQMTPSARQIILEDTHILEAGTALSKIMAETQ